MPRMLFVLKRTWTGALLGLVVLTLLGLGLRWLLGTGAAVVVSPGAVLFGLAAIAVVLASDGLLHGLFLLVFGDAYRRRHLELAAVFRHQSIAAILVGALMAALGQELVFRGLSTNPFYLGGAAVAFGLLHHIRRSLWPFTLWAIWQGALFAGALYSTRYLFADSDLYVTMQAHFLHDLTGFLIFRYLNRAAYGPRLAGGPSESTPGKPGAI